MATKEKQVSAGLSDEDADTAKTTGSARSAKASAKVKGADSNTATGETTMNMQSEETAGETPEASAVERELMSLQAVCMIERHSVAAASVGVVPIPIVDLIGVAGVQLNMLRKLSNHYGVPFSANKGKNIIAALIGGAIPAYGAMPLFYLVRNVPIIGWTLGAGAASLLAGASTYAVGHVLENHFAAGGSMDNLDIDEARSSFKDFLARGKERMSNLYKGKGDASAASTAEDVAAEAVNAGAATAA